MATLPKPNGKYGVHLSTMKLTDETRIDPFASIHQFRSVMISAFYPVVLTDECRTRLVSYMLPATATIESQYYSQYGLPTGTFEKLQLSLCKVDCRMTAPLDEFPIVLFSPGLGNSRLLYSAIAQSIASSGNIVISIDHPYDANVVEYPDGTLVLAANISSDAQIKLDVNTRVKDASFILDQLSLTPTVRLLFPSANGHLKTHNVTMYGHSVGGAAAAAAMLEDSRIIGGANLDGSFFGPVIEQGLNRPFLIFGHEGKNQSTDPSWKAIWPRLRGWKLELMLHGAQHATFSDLPLLVKVLGLDKVLPPEAATLLGMLDGVRALDVVSAYLVAFFDFVRSGIPAHLLQGPAKEYPEISLVAT